MTDKTVQMSINKSESLEDFEQIMNVQAYKQFPVTWLNKWILLPMLIVLSCHQLAMAVGFDMSLYGNL